MVKRHPVMFLLVTMCLQALWVQSGCVIDTVNVAQDVACSPGEATDGARRCVDGVWVAADAGTHTDPGDMGDMDGGDSGECMQRSDEELCENMNANCGQLAVVDDCGVPRMLSCGTCSSDEMCDDETNRCLLACQGETVDVLCERKGAKCGMVSVQNMCGALTEVNCGSCGSEEECDLSTNLCVCIPKEQATLCREQNATCGLLTVDDGCGTSVQIECGSCGMSGDFNCIDNVCDCTPENDNQLCGRLGAQCGMIEATNNCGQSVEIDCGGCDNGDACKDDNTCPVCQPFDDEALCANAGLQCGQHTVTDNCGNSKQVTCSDCTNDRVCNSAGLCVCPAPLCSGVACGSVSNACGSTTPCPDTCDAITEQCAGNSCVCKPETDTELCGDAGATCGSITVTDRCGTSRTVSCGGCGGSEVCTNNSCCSPDSDFTLCSMNGRECDSFSVTDNCGVQRTITSCGTCNNDETCGMNGSCGCPAPSCSGVACGMVSNACGRTRNCTNTCDATTEQCAGNSCVCKPETDTELCGDAGATCGSITVTDRCGTSRTIVCGSCGADEICNASNQCECPMPLCAGVACGSISNACGSTTMCADTCDAATEQCVGNSCVCKAESDAELCNAAGAECGTITVTDRCTMSRTIDCSSVQGMCTDAECAVVTGNQANQCCSASDIASECANQNYCGTITDMNVCGGVIASVDCRVNDCSASGDVCDMSADPEVCCTPLEADEAALCGEFCLPVDFNPQCGQSMRTIDCAQLCTDKGGTCNGGNDKCM